MSSETDSVLVNSSIFTNVTATDNCKSSQTFFPGNFKQVQGLGKPSGNTCSEIILGIITPVSDS